MKYLCKFLTSALAVRQFPPPTVAEVAFLGRSNVGKSSVINALLGEKVAKTSSTPGRTQTINFFAVRRPGAPRPDVIFADLPGYGFARVSREVSAEWPSFIDPYLRERETLTLCICLVDANVPTQERDRQLLEFLRAEGRNVLVVATKADRLSNNQLRNALTTLGRELETDNILPFSAKTGNGKEELWKAIRTAAGTLDTQSATG